MATKQQDEYLKTALGVDLARHRAVAPAVAKQGAPSAPPPRPAPSVPPGAEEDPPPPVLGGVPGGASGAAPASEATDAAPVKLPAGMAMIQPQDLVKLRAGLASIAREIKDGLARQQEIEAEAKKAHVDPTKTDAFAKAGARLGAVLSKDERHHFNDTLSQVRKSRESIVELLDRADETKEHLANFRALKLEGVSAEDKEKKGHEVAGIYDFVVNSMKYVIDIVTGDVARFGALILAQANLETLDSDVAKDSIEASVDGIQEEQNKILDGLNDMVSKLNDFRAAEIDTLVKTLHHLGRELVERFDILKADLKEMGDQIRDIGNAHKGDAGNFGPLMSVYRKIAEADVLLSKVDALAQRSVLAEKRWPDLLVPLGTRDQYPESVGENAVALVYRKSGAPHYFIVKAYGATFATGDGAAEAIEKLADDYKSLQAARDAYGQVKPLAEQWSKALSTGMDNPPKR
jgi:hypothetical protein